jgi:hypothetical protein
MELEAIFEHVGLTREQIARLGGGVQPQTVEKPQGAKPRPKCLVCGRRINKRNCRPHRQRPGRL